MKTLNKYIHPITLQAALEVASNLRSDDFRELSDGHGLDPLLYLAAMSSDPSAVYFTAPSGKAAGMAGVGDKGDIWMLCTMKSIKHRFYSQDRQSGSSIAVRSLYFGI